MSPSEHAIAYVQKHNPENKKEKCLEFIDITNSKACAAVKENISKTRKKIVEVKNSILDKSKIEDLAKKSGLLEGSPKFFHPGSTPLPLNPSEIL
jgi:5-bromo-4-chloroindolyl phosphate hydrolysis protein